MQVKTAKFALKRMPNEMDVCTRRIGIVPSGTNVVIWTRQSGGAYPSILGHFRMKKGGPSNEVVAAYLRPEFDAALRRALSSDRLVTVSSWAELWRVLDTRPIAVVLADPSAAGRLEPECILDLLKKFPAIPMRAYVSVTASEIKAIALLSRHGLEDVILHGTDDISPHFASTLMYYRSIPYIAELLHALEAQLNRLPGRLEWVVRDVFQNPHNYSSATHIARNAGITIGMLYRSCQDAKFSSPKKLVVAAKVLRGSSYLLEPGSSIQGIAKKLGYADARGFAEHVGQVFAKPPSVIRTEMDFEKLVPYLLRWLRGGTKSSPKALTKRASTR